MWGIRKIITIVSITVLAFVVVFCLIGSVDVPDSVNAIIMALIGYIGYYFGKSTALDEPPRDK